MKLFSETFFNDLDVALSSLISSDSKRHELINDTLNKTEEWINSLPAETSALNYRLFFLKQLLDGSALGLQKERKGSNLPLTACL
ncbi:MAG: hypothetical protein GY777_26035 [Candidatus Brocadiaceae bacterium]|nr:hypothetical protein [Candidatus Brocadiaceae bacterium]